MKRITVFLIAVMWVAGIAGTLYADDPAKRLDDLLSTNALDGFIATVEADRLSVPVIPSQWFADRVATDVERVRISTARTFGSNLLQRLDEYASQVVTVSNLAQCVQHADVLLRVASWLGGADGYENAILAARAQDVATVPASRLLVATNYPTDKVALLVLRLAGSWYAADVRARILDVEAGTNLFTASATGPLTPRVLEEVWTLGQWRRASQRGEIAPDFKITGIDQGRVDLGVLDQHLEFFQPSESLGNRTTRERWSSKNHEAFVFGLESANVRMLRALARFRELVGEFPTSVPYTNHPFASQQEAAFEYAWRPHRGKEGAIYGDALYAYQKITRAEFVDQDTAIARMRNTGGSDAAK